MQVMRIWFGCTLGMALSMLFGWSYGFFAVMLPLFVLSQVPQFRWPLLKQMWWAVFCTTIEATLLIQVFQFHWLLQAIAVAIFLLYQCILLSSPRTELKGYVGVLVGSIVLNFASFSFFDMEEFNINLWIIATANIGICALAYYLFPEPVSNGGALAANAVQQVSDKRRITQVVLGWSVAMVTFVLFQLFDLYDSLAALATVLIIIKPMTFVGAVTVARVRMLGTLLGCFAGLVIQLLLGAWFSDGLLMWLAFVLATGPFCWLLTKGPIKAAIAFSAMSALSVPLTTGMVPEQKDATFSILYRFSSIAVAVMLSLLLIWMVQCLIKRAEQKIA
ncbi:hypothetical protein VST7929_03140 [Vibrio stylophorae]|uniref:Integral membrane bound transporter domain-containing protein n=1 Tax=Vibrio stylophorae TaxID=659351 RepID=A0ABN8DVZ9_9VIBR|nr:hypothetical protein VST7929_03140 [Vibrio stylophorae]